MIIASTPRLMREMEEEVGAGDVALGGGSEGSGIQIDTVRA